MSSITNSSDLFRVNNTHLSKNDNTEQAIVEKNSTKQWMIKTTLATSSEVTTFGCIAMYYYYYYN